MQVLSGCLRMGSPEQEEAETMASVQHQPALSSQERDCLGLTCLKWSSSGELEAIDLQLVLERLATADPSLCVLSSCSVDEHSTR